MTVAHLSPLVDRDRRPWSRCVFGVRSPACSTTLLDTSRQRGSDAGRIRQPDLRSHRVTDAVCEVEAWSARADSRGQHSDRQERVDAQRYSRVGDVHVRGCVRPRQYRVRCRSQGQRSALFDVSFNFVSFYLLVSYFWFFAKSWVVA